MYLEIDQLCLSELHPTLHPAVKQFNANDPVSAFEHATTAIRAVARDQRSADDWILVGNLAQICGFTNRCTAAYRIGARAFPNDARLAALYAWELSARSQDQRCKKVLKNANTNQDTHQAFLIAVACYNHSLNRWIKTAEKHHHAALKLAGDDPIVLYVLSRAAARRTDWKMAVELGRRVIEIMPGWARAKSALFDSYLSIGKIKPAVEILNSAKKDQRHVWVDFCQATFFEINNQREQAIDYLARLVQYYPAKSKMMKFCQRQLILLLMQTDRIAEAKQWAEKFSVDGFEEWEKLVVDDQRKAYISMPMVSQTLDHCVPTVAAMAATAQGFQTSPGKLAKEMETRNGTPMWRMVDAMRKLGFRTVCIKPQRDIVVKLLDQGIPLIGELSGIFGGHVDAVCGYSAALQIFHMRDPMHWYGFSISYEAMEKRYESTCSLWALIAPEKTDSITINPDWHNHEAQAFIDMSRAIALGQRTVAEAEFKKIADDHPLSFARDAAARNVVLTSAQADQRLKMEVDSISADSEMTLPKIRAMLSILDDKNADHILEIAKSNEEKLSKQWVQYVSSQALLAKMKWRAAEKQLTLMTRRWPSTESLWSQLATVKEELGKSDEAEKCLSIALEITPQRQYFHTRNVEQMKLKIPFDEQLKRHHDIAQRFPDATELKFSLATLLADGADGLKYEKSLRDCIKFFPRNSWPYEQLSDWYASQDRSDLAVECIQSGRKLIGEKELPVSDWEKKYLDEKSDNASETAITQDNSAPASLATDSVPQTPPTKNKSVIETIDQRLGQFQNWFKIAYEKSFELSFEEFQKLSELNKLKQSDANHEFNWHQSVAILSLQLRNLLADQSESFVTQPDARVTAFRSALPNKVTGIPESFAETLLEQLSFENASTRIIQAMYQWLDKIAPNCEAYPNLVFQKAYLLELMLKLTESEQMLNRLVEQHPCFAVGWYRIGQMQIQRADYNNAWNTLSKCLEIQPGHYGAMTELKRLADSIAPDQSQTYADAVATRLPYSNHFLYNAAILRVNNDDCSLAIEEIEKRRSLIGDSACAVIIGRIFTDVGHYQKGLETIKNSTIAHIDLYSADWICVDCLVQLERYDEAKSYLEKLDRKHPGDEGVIDQKVRLLRLSDPQAAVEYASQKITDGNAIMILAYVDIQNRPQPAAHAIKTLKSLPAEYADRTAMAYAEAIYELKQPIQSEKFLQHCAKNLPHLTALRRLLVSVLDSNGKNKQAINAARLLHAYEPENPQWLQLLGDVVQDENPKESISLLEKEFAMTDSVDTLAKIGRGYQLQGNNAKAIESYEQVLKRNPNHTLALCNLLLRYKRDDLTILEMTLDTIKKSMVGDSDQYFLVQAVKLAIKHNVQLPPQWFELAIGRYQRLEIEQPFQDERALLSRAIAAWCSRWDINSNQLGIGILDRLASKWIWPKHSWIPNKKES